jgi:hypothetical protein
MTTKVLQRYLQSGEPQYPTDTYIWNNTQNTTTKKFSFVQATIDYGGAIGVVPRENVHFWDEEVSFDGTKGVGVGLLAARPSTCTTGVGYWATDESILYKATATNTWTAYYTPYTYPHPLRLEGLNTNNAIYAGSKISIGAGAKWRVT